MPTSRNSQQSGSRKQNPFFFSREEDGSVRLRIRFNGPEATLFEEAAGSQPLMEWIYEALNEKAREQIAAREKYTHIPEPAEEEGA